MPLIIFIFLIVYLFYSVHESSPSLAGYDFLKPISMSAEVVSLVKHQQCYQSFTLQPLHKNYYVQASWYACNALNLHVGDILNATVVLKPLHAMNNPGSFDMVQWASQNHIVAQATIKSGEKIGEASDAMTNLQRLREHLQAITQQHLNQFTENRDIPSVIESLTLGIGQNISWEVLQDFNLSGTRHLLSISGSHIAMVAMITYVIFFSVMRLLIVFRSTWNAHTLALAFSVLFIGFYVSISGEQLPTLRALWMALLGLCAAFLHRYSSLMYRIFIAAVVVLVVEPQAIYSPSFYLTFCAVFLIAYHQVWGKTTTQRLSKIKSYLQLNFLLLVGLLPISLYFFSQYSLITFFANLVAIPWVGVLILPLAILLQWLSYCYIPCDFLWHFLSYATQAFLSVLHFFAILTEKIPGLFITGHKALWLSIILFFMMLLFFLPRGVPGRCISMMAMLSIFLWKDHPKKGEAEIIFMNVGQGLSVLVKTEKHLLVYDTGPNFFTGGDVGQSILMPYFYYRGWRTIDMLMVSHGDSDHAGGVKTLQHHMQIKKMLTSAIKKFPEATLCERGQHWRWDNVEFRLIYPDDAHQGKDNNSSCVLKITAGAHSVLLTGDIEKSAEQYLTRVFPQDLPANVMSVPHHGSKTSSSDDFLVAIHPDYAIFSFGFLNRFRFPNAVVMQRYETQHILPVVTESGPVVVMLSPQTLDIYHQKV